MIIDKMKLDDLSAQARTSPRLRHSLECLKSGLVLCESKDEPYHPLEENELME